MFFEEEKVIRDYLSSEEDRNFLDHIISQVGARGPNREAMAIFAAIQHCFDGASGEEVVVNSYLLHNLAACACVALEYNRDVTIPWHKGDHDYVVLRAFNGFTHTLIETIRESRCDIRQDGSCRLNSFTIPAWFVIRAKQIH